MIENIKKIDEKIDINSTISSINNSIMEEINLKEEKEKCALEITQKIMNLELEINVLKNQKDQRINDIEKKLSSLNETQNQSFNEFLNLKKNYENFKKLEDNFKNSLEELKKSLLYVENYSIKGLIESIDLVKESQKAIKEILYQLKEGWKVLIDAIRNIYSWDCISYYLKRYWKKFNEDYLFEIKSFLYYKYPSIYDDILIPTYNDDFWSKYFTEEINENEKEFLDFQILDLKDRVLYKAKSYFYFRTQKDDTNIILLHYNNFATILFLMDEFNEKNYLKKDNRFLILKNKINKNDLYKKLNIEENKELEDKFTEYSRVLSIVNYPDPFQFNVILESKEVERPFLKIDFKDNDIIKEVRHKDFKKYTNYPDYLIKDYYESDISYWDKRNHYQCFIVKKNNITAFEKEKDHILDILKEIVIYYKNLKPIFK